MADRPQVPGWTNINLNKPEEYSSEFVVGNLRYANVTNTSNGQRQLYLVSGLGGTALTNRTLLTTTNNDGTVTKGSGYNDFTRQYGATALTEAEKANKQQSVALLSTPGVSTKEEAAKIQTSSQFKSTPAGQNASKGEDLTSSSNSLFGTGETLGTDNNGLPGAGAAALKYPRDMSPQQDHIEFKMIEYSPRSLTSAKDANTGAAIAGDVNVSSVTAGNISGINDRRNPNTAASLGTVILPINSAISDLNSTGWGTGDMDPGTAAMASVFLTGLKNGVGAAVDEAQAKTEQATSGPNANATKTALGSVLTASAINKPDILSRTTGAIINPNTELLFNGVTLRPFTFIFRMSARSKEEGDDIKRIIFFFKKGMAAKRTKQGLFLKAPNTFTIKYKHGGEDHKAINKIKECALLSCSVNYVPDGQYAAHADGNLTSYEMQLQFTELEPVFFDEYTGTDNVGY